MTWLEKRQKEPTQEYRRHNNEVVRYFKDCDFTRRSYLNGVIASIMVHTPSDS